MVAEFVRSEGLFEGEDFSKIVAKIYGAERDDNMSEQFLELLKGMGFVTVK